MATELIGVARADAAGSEVCNRLVRRRYKSGRFFASRTLAIYMNDPQPEGHMASYIARRKFLATLGGAAAA
jgi:hypothetical protein